MNPRFHCLSWAMVAMSTSWLCNSVAQTEGDADVYELSPFVVDSSDADGYRANSTLAGTRLKTNLKDIAASVSVVTTDFMEDIGATDITSLLTYVGNTEAPGLGGNFSNANTTENQGFAREERTGARPQENTRVRGLASADTTQEYFLTRAPFDYFNIEQVTINRGPNAALFGLGSPGGVLNAGLKRASFRDFGSLETKIDHWGSQRYVLDINRVVVEDKVAVRLVGLYEDSQFEQKQAWERDSRFYADVLITPFKNTRLRVNYTSGEMKGARPETLLPLDQISTWMALGKPLYDMFKDQYYMSIADWQNNVPVAAATRALWNQRVFGNDFGNSQGQTYTVIFGDHDSPHMGGWGAPDGYVPGFTRGNMPTIPATFTFLPRARNQNTTNNMLQAPAGSIPGINSGLTSGEQGYYSARRITDRSVFDYRKNLLPGPNKLEGGRLESYSAFLEQTFFDNKVGVEAAFYNELYEDELVKYTGFNAGLTVDMNILLPDGTRNPHLGRPFVGGNGFAEPQFRREKASRLTVFGEYDFAENRDEGWLSKMGRHILTAMVSNQESDFRRETHMAAVAETELRGYWTGNTITNIAGPNRLAIHRYMGPSILDAGGFVNLDIPGITARQVTGNTINGMLWDNKKYVAGSPLIQGVNNKAVVRTTEYVTDPERTRTWGNTRTRSVVDSQVAILQSYFFSGKLVTTGSWRKDEVEQTTGNAPASPATGLNYGGWPEDSTLLLNDREEIISWGAVAHSPEFINNYLPWDMELSVHFNDASNFSASNSATTIYGKTIPLQSGETTEFGFSVNLLEGKLAARVNFYESSQKNARMNPVSRHQEIYRNVLQFNTPAEIAAVTGWVPPPADYIATNQFFMTGGFNTTDTGIVIPQWDNKNPQQNAVRDTEDNTAKGMEIDLTYNPTRNWRISFNASKQEATRSNLAPDAARFIAESLPIWSNPAVGNKLWMGTDRETQLIVDGVGQVDTAGNPIMVENTNTRMLNPATGQLHPSVANNMTQVYSITSREGQAAAELRKWRWNLVTNYSFNKDSFLKGLGVGSALRWQDKILIGNPIKLENNVWVPDLSQSYYGDAELKVDLWVTYKRTLDVLGGIDWSVRLGARNITSGHGLIEVNSNPDGTIANYRIEEPTTYELTSTFRF